jgi:hypothetical protein
VADTSQIIERAMARGRWRVEESVQVAGRFLVYGPRDTIMADGLYRIDAERLVGSYNRACDDADALAGQAPPTPASRLSIVTGGSDSPGSKPKTFE